VRRMKSLLTKSIIMIVIIIRATFSLARPFATNEPNRSEFDSLNVRFVSNWPFGPSNAVAYDSVKNIAYCSSGGGIYIVDITNPSLPCKISDAIRVRGEIEDIFFERYTQRLYIVDGYGYDLEIWNVFNDSAPYKLGVYHTPYYAWGVTVVSGIYAYVADADSGLRIINVADPANPFEIGKFYTSGLMCDVEVVNGYAYIVDCNGLMIVDVLDPTNPQLIGGYNTMGFAYSVAVSGSYAYVAHSYNGLLIFDVSDPTNPTLVGELDTPGSATTVKIQNGYAYLTDGRLRIINVADAYNPYEVGNFWSPHSIYNVTVSGSNAYLPNSVDGLRIIDCTDPTTPLEIGNYDTPGSIAAIYIDGQYVYLAGQRDCFAIIDKSNILYPYEIGRCYGLGYTQAMTIEGSYAYVAGGFEDLQIINIADPANPTIVTNYDTPGDAMGIDVAGNYAYVADFDSGMCVLDISDPANPFEVGSYSFPALVNDVVVDPPYAYVATGDSGLRILNITDPTNPNEVDHCDVPSAYRIVKHGTLAYIASMSNGLQIVNIDNLSHPRVIGTYLPPMMTAWDVAVSDNYAYVLGYWDMMVVDVSNPASPEEVGYYHVPYPSSDLAALSSYIFFPFYDIGLQIFNNQLFEMNETSERLTNIELRILQNPISKGNIKLQYCMCKSLKTMLYLYNTLGQKINEMVLPEQEGTVNWRMTDIRGNQLPSGIYFIKAICGPYSTTVKAIVVR